MEQKFKVGQKVRITNTNHGQHGYAVGEVVEIKSLPITQGGTYFLTGGTIEGGYSQDGQYVYEKSFEAIPTLDLTKPLETQNGDPVTVVLTDARGDDPIRGYIGDGDVLLGWRSNGQYYRDEPCWRDLRNVVPKPVEIDGYINVYKRRDGTLDSGGAQATRADADTVAAGLDTRVGCIKVKLVEGQWDE